MDRIPCLVSIDSDLSEDKTLSHGSFEATSERIRFTWSTKEEEEGLPDMKFLLTYQVKEKVLRLSRRGATESDMLFRLGEKTEGVIRTSHGDFDLELATRELSFFEEGTDTHTTIEGQTYLVKTGRLTYDLCFAGQEPMRNHMTFHVHIAENSDI